jgi:hypothetical protein
LSLQKRTAPPPEPVKSESPKIEAKAKPAVASKPKVSPFGSATAIDTASKLAALDLKEKEKKEEPPKAPQLLKKEGPEKEVSKESHAEGTKEEEKPAEVTPSPKQEEKENAGKKEDAPKKEDAKRRDEKSKRREPKVVNARAAALETAPDIRPAELRKEVSIWLPQIDSTLIGMLHLLTYLFSAQRSA